MVAKVTDGFDEIFNFSSSKSWMQYGHVVRAAPTVPMVAKVIVTYEHNFFVWNLHVPLCINITSKMAKEKTAVYISKMRNR
jgi:hypothetical protein